MPANARKAVPNAIPAQHLAPAPAAAEAVVSETGVLVPLAAPSPAAQLQQELHRRLNPERVPPVVIYPMGVRIALFAVAGASAWGIVLGLARLALGAFD